jgi:hypothetical protein
MVPDFSYLSDRTIRPSLEKNIRFAHDLTLPNFFFLLIARKRRAGEMSDLHRAIESLPLEVRGEVKKVVHNGMKTLILMMVFKSPVAIIAFGPAIVASLLVDGCRKQAAKAVKFSSALIQLEAENAPSAFVIPGSHTDTTPTQELTRPALLFPRQPLK